MLLKVAYYAIDSYLLMLCKKCNEIHRTTQNSCFQSKFTVLVHRPFSTTVQEITKDVMLFLLSDNLILLHYSH